MAVRKRAVQALLSLVLATLLMSCASKPPEDIVVRGTLNAAEDLNPAADGRASPLMVKIFQLKSRDKFASADIFPLLDQAEAALGADLLSVQEIMLTPGETRTYAGKFAPEARYIGVVGAYRDSNQARWKDTVEMPGKSLLKFLKRRAIVVDAQSLAISISIDD